MSKQVEILIVGAGPVGLSLALMLHQQGISSKIIDQRAGPTTSSNAIAINPRTLEIFKTLGILDKVQLQGLKLYFANYFINSKLLNRLDFSNVASEFKYMLALPQAQTEKILSEELATVGIAIDWHHELTQLTYLDDKVEAICQSQGSEQSIVAKWVIGCDGYHSSVRELSGIRRNCHDLGQHFLMLDAILSDNLQVDSLDIMFHQSGSTLIVPMHYNVRVIFEISNDPKYKHLKSGTPEIFGNLLRERCPEFKLEQIDWMSAFYVHECLVDQYIKGRIILAGDAAHSHSPAGGQGMNTGIQDAWNLSWKLAHVVCGKATDELLKTYELERRAVAKNVLKRSGILTKLATTSNTAAKFFRNFAIRYIMQLAKVKQQLVNSLAQTDICYKQCGLINLRPYFKSINTRYQITKPTWHLLTKEIVDKKCLPDFITIIDAGDFVLAKGQTMCLVRPDGYVALYASELITVQEYFTSNGIKI